MPPTVREPAPRTELAPRLRSDNGIIFQSRRFRRACRDYRLRQEFITPYTSEQNGIIEWFFRSLKEGCAWQHRFQTFTEAQWVIRDWLRWYSEARPHQALGYLRPGSFGLNNHHRRLDLEGALHDGRDVLNDRAPPFYEEQGGAVQQINHWNTKVHAPYTNGFCERFHRTVSDEFFKVAFRTKFYGSLAELQEDLDAWLETYNTTWPLTRVSHPGSDHAASLYRGACCMARRRSSPSAV